MRVILSAFQGKLTSEVMDYPEGTGWKIDLIMDIATPKISVMEEPDLTKPLYKRATFEFKGKEMFDDKPQPIREYVLVDVS